MKHIGTQRIETERLILRKFTVSDSQQMFDNWANDSEVTKYLTWPPHRTVAFTKKLLTDWVANYQKDDYYTWCIELRKGSQAIGSVGSVDISGDIDAVEIGYCIGKAYWGKGIMTEALKAIIDFFFCKTNANRIQAVHDVRNPDSGRVMTKCGMKYEGTHIQAARNQQGLCDIAVYGIVKRDYKAI